MRKFALLTTLGVVSSLGLFAEDNKPVQKGEAPPATISFLSDYQKKRKKILEEEFQRRLLDLQAEFRGRLDELHQALAGEELDKRGLSASLYDMDAQRGVLVLKEKPNKEEK